MRGLDASGHEAIQRIGPQAVFLAHFGFGPGDDPSGFEVLPAVGAFVAVGAPGALPVERLPGTYLKQSLWKSSVPRSGAQIFVPKSQHRLRILPERWSSHFSVPSPALGSETTAEAT